jgi:hypothetical protein
MPKKHRRKNNEREKEKGAKTGERRLFGFSTAERGRGLSCMGATQPGLPDMSQRKKSSHEPRGFCWWVYIGVYRTGGIFSGSPDQSPSPY